MVSSGDLIGTYRVATLLGSGGMGEVWLAEHPVLGRRVAIKLLRPEVSQRIGVVGRFLDEARAAAQVSDPGIVQVHDVGRQDDRAYIVMEYLVGEVLSSRLGRLQRLPVANAARLVQQIAMTMAVAHARGIVHRDLKPDNLFVVADPAVPGAERAKILDFGIAKLLAHEAMRTQEGSILGTPMYMSPEQCRDSAGVDHRTDIYAAGCVLYHLVSGRPPFAGDTAGELIAAHLVDQPLSPNVDDELDAIVLRCLAKSPDDRFGSMTELARALAPFTGTALDIPTIAPMKRTSAMVAVPPTALPFAATTLATGAGEARPVATLRSRAPIAGVAAAIVAAIVVLAVWTQRADDQASAIVQRTEDAPVLDAPVLDARAPDVPPVGAPSVDAAPDAARLRRRAPPDDLYSERGD